MQEGGGAVRGISGEGGMVQHLMPELSLVTGVVTQVELI